MEQENNKKQRLSRQKVFKSPTYIEPTRDELSIVIEGLTTFYKNNPNFLKNNESIEDKIKSVVDECKEGWVCAQKTFLERIKFKTKWNRKEIENRKDFKKTLYNAQQIELLNEIEENSKDLGLTGTSSAFSLFKKLLTPEQRKFLQMREKSYRSEFDFNDSSDSVLLTQVLTEELTQIKYQQYKLENPNQNLDLEISASNKRLIDALKALGITRDQRESSKLETEGNIAQLAMTYETRLKEIDKLKEKMQAEEDVLMEKKKRGELISVVRDDLKDVLRKAHSEEELEAESFVDDDKDSLI